MSLVILYAAAFRNVLQSLTAFTPSPADDMTRNRPIVRRPKDTVAGSFGGLDSERRPPQSRLHWGGFQDNFFAYDDAVSFKTMSL